jgi:hypothetical protein
LRTSIRPIRAICPNGRGKAINKNLDKSELRSAVAYQAGPIARPLNANPNGPTDMKPHLSGFRGYFRPGPPVYPLESHRFQPRETAPDAENGAGHGAAAAGERVD